VHHGRHQDGPQNERVQRHSGREADTELGDLAPAQRENVEIADHLTLSPLTVKTHANHAMTKLGARDRAQLVVFAYQAGLVDHIRTHGR
jgi:ATP/maltotriose-dependent transcriptional regulator MalT